MKQVKFCYLEPGSLFYVEPWSDELPWMKLALIQDAGNCVDSDGFITDAPSMVWIDEDDAAFRLKGE